MKKKLLAKKVVAVILMMSLLMVSTGTVFAEDVAEKTTEVEEMQNNDAVIEEDSEQNNDAIENESNSNKVEVNEGTAENPSAKEEKREFSTEEEQEVQGNSIDEISEEPKIVPVIQYEAHVQNIGWQNAVEDGTMAGTVGKALAMEGLRIELKQLDGIQGSVEYETHVQDIGWQNAVSNGELAGTVGKAKAIEAIKIRLTGEIADQYDIYYRVHSDTYGWFDWAKNGEVAGSVGFAYAMQAIEIRLYEKNSEEKPIVSGKTYLTANNMGDVIYQAHVKNVGWQSKVVDGKTAGTTGRALGIEGITLRLGEHMGGTIVYKAHVSGIGWQNEVTNGTLAGTTGQNRSMEAICVRVADGLEEKYDVYYRTHVSGFGWLNWTKNGEISGSVGYATPIEAIQVKLYEKDSSEAPETTGVSCLSRENIAEIEYQAHVSDIGWQNAKVTGEIAGTTGQNKSIEAIAMSIKKSENAQIYSGGISYKLHVSDIGWQDWCKDGSIAGAVGQGKRAEAIQIKLTGEMEKYCDIYYRAHVSNFGWLGWAKNGESAGSSGYAYNLEAVQIKVVPKNTSAPGSTSNSFKKAPPSTVSAMAMRANLYTSSTSYLILVNRSTHKVGIFQGWRGNWNNIVTWDCADGAVGTPTVEGTFRVGSRGYYFDSGASRCFWWTQFYGNYLFHSVLYNKNGTLRDGRVGMALSHGCVRLQIGNAKWIYDNIPSGTTVVVYH
ncbi:L,D-transpeptidase family protein [Bariatricus sp. SGI.154]|uniref:L,D-transpeptidase family protein n=1 Tax=Bariatricus sp. SGI.154 TaxID=3420549 RepID=UPI003D065ED4